MRDPRDPVVQIRPDWPDPPIHLVAPVRTDGAADASVHRAKQAQQAERDKAIADILPKAADDLHATMLLDSVDAQRVAALLPPDVPYQERLGNAAVAVRLSDTHWQAVTHYRASEAILRVLRNVLSAHGVDGCIPDKALRAAAEQCDRVGMVARLATWEGREPVSARMWACAQLSLLSLSEDGQ